MGVAGSDRAVVVARILETRAPVYITNYPSNSLISYSRRRKQRSLEFSPEGEQQRDSL